MSASSPRSTSSNSRADSLELDKTFWADPLSASVRGGRTSGSEDLARVLQSEREYWCRLCVQQVGEMEKAMQAKVEALEGRILEMARKSVGPLLDEAAGGLHAESRQEAEVQRVERESAAIHAAKAEVEARCSAKLDVAEAAVRELRDELREARSERRAMQDALQERRREMIALSRRLERLEDQRLEQAQPATALDASRRGVDISRACAAADSSPRPTAPHAAEQAAVAACAAAWTSLAGARAAAADSSPSPLRSASLAPRGDAPDGAAEAPGASSRRSRAAAAPARPSAGPAGAQLPCLLGRGRPVSPTKSCPKGAILRDSLRGGGGSPALRRASPRDSPAALHDGLRDSLKQVVSAVQRTLDDFQEEEPREGAPGASEQSAPPPRAPGAAPARVAALPRRAPGQQAVRQAPLSAVTVHPPQTHAACQVIVPPRQPGGPVALKPAVQAQFAQH